MKKSLFNKYEAYTDIGRKVSDELQKAIDPIIKKWADKGYSINGIESIAIDSIAMVANIERMERSIKMRKEKHKVEDDGIHARVKKECEADEETEDFEGCGPFII